MNAGITLDTIRSPDDPPDIQSEDEDQDATNKQGDSYAVDGHGVDEEAVAGVGEDDVRSLEGGAKGDFDDDDDEDFEPDPPLKSDDTRFSDPD